MLDVAGKPIRRSSYDVYMIRTTMTDIHTDEDWTYSALSCSKIKTLTDTELQADLNYFEDFRISYCRTGHSRYRLLNIYVVGSTTIHINLDEGRSSIDIFFRISTYLYKLYCGINNTYEGSDHFGFTDVSPVVYSVCKFLKTKGVIDWDAPQMIKGE